MAFSKWYIVNSYCSACALIACIVYSILYIVYSSSQALMAYRACLESYEFRIKLLVFQSINLI